MSPALKYWDGSAWQTLPAVAGPQGPPGPMRELAAVGFGTITAAGAPGALVVDFGAITFDGGPCVFEIAAAFLTLYTNGSGALNLYDFATGSDVLVSRVAYFREGVTTDSGGQWFPFSFQFRYTPSAGSHRYRIRFQNDGPGSAPILNQIDSLQNFARIVKAA